MTYKERHKAVQNGKARVGDKGSFDQWIWTWELLEGERAGSTIDLKTPPKIELGDFYSAARVAYEALLGQPIEIGEEVDTDLVVGLKARVVIGHLDPETRGDRTYYNSAIKDILPVRDGDADVSSPWDNSDEPPF